MINGQMTPLLPSIKDMLWRFDGCQAFVGTCVLAQSRSDATPDHPGGPMQECLSLGLELQQDRSIRMTANAMSLVLASAC